MSFTIRYDHTPSVSSYPSFDDAVSAARSVFPSGDVETFDEGTVTEHALVSQGGRVVARIVPAAPQYAERIAESTGFAVGDRVETTCVDEHYDRGRVLEMHGVIATVSWDSGMVATCHVDELIAEGSWDDELTGELYDAETGAWVREATRTEVLRSTRAARDGKDHGIILLDGRRVYAEAHS